MNHLIKTATLSSVALALFGCNQTLSPDQTSHTSRPVQVIEIAHGNTALEKSFSGIVEAKESAALSFRVPGTLSSVLVKKGDYVVQGEVLARLDPHDYQVSLDELKARMLEAKSANKLATAELTRVKQATAEDAIASVNLDRAISGYERSVSAVKVVEKNIQRAEDALGYTELRAPFSGIISEVNVKQFEQTIPGLSVVTLQQEGNWEAEIDVPENMIQEFSLGQQATLTWYGAEQSYAAVVSEIAPKKHMLKQTYAVTLDVNSTSADLFYGKAVTVSTHFTPKNSSHCFPYSALLGKKANLHVHVVREKVVHSEPVSLESIDANQACVTGNFEQGDYLVTSGSHYLNGGDITPNLIIKTL